MSALSEVKNTIDQSIIPALEKALGELSSKGVQLASILTMIPFDALFPDNQEPKRGRKKKNRAAIAKLLTAKALWNLVTTKFSLDFLRCSTELQRLCGFSNTDAIPSESTLSRAFAEFAKNEIGKVIHEALIVTNLGEKLMGHNSQDSTAIEAREKPVHKPKKPKAKKKKGRPHKGEEPRKKEIKKLDVQVQCSLEANLQDLSKACDVGCKRNSQGYTTSWSGYKLHMSCVDGDIPVSALITSASTHDSQVAIPLMQMTSQRIDHLYDLMDSAYDAPQIKEYSKGQGHVPIIDHNRRRGEKVEMEPASKVRYRERSTAERVNSNLKDNFGGRHVRVRSAAKVMCHLMWGLIAMTGLQLLRMLDVG